MLVFVTGDTGFLGSAMVQPQISTGPKIRGYEYRGLAGGDSARSDPARDTAALQFGTNCICAALSTDA